MKNGCSVEYLNYGSKITTRNGSSNGENTAEYYGRGKKKRKMLLNLG